ncbi:hypothetical protein BY996DRAFT_6736453 [Phakopsora pachyrhizi]|uniref:Wax synthase domain-containing protein n=1 Tax=Phakopsora pachyrhizi TaxID=170000 RepID=A0AAV0B7X8_PHAPC|nr:hypothetical protein BY996DRAFT_6736453 [Phakopsora pachyrhizi]CAH7682125.1 hypothetical protein PPACK8108_LOCUS14847 [Phakopsora pachyrhizi]
MEVINLLSIIQGNVLFRLLSSIALILTILTIAAMTLPSASLNAHAFRFMVFCFLFPYIIHFNTSRANSLGHWSFDCWLCLICWHFIYVTIEICLLPLISPCAPKWIKPTDEEYERLDKWRKKDKDDSVKEPPIPKEWKTLPYPPLISWSRILYAFDIISLSRPGTSHLLRWQLRAFDWSLPAFKKPHISSRFGKPECSARVATIHLLVFFASFAYIYHFVSGLTRPIESINQLSILNQLLLTISAGSWIAFSFTMLEVIMFQFVLERRISPASALTPEFNQPYLAKSIEDFWGNRWHHKYRRHFTRIASLFPYGRTKIGNVLWTFIVSGMMHSYLIARSKPEPSIKNLKSYLPIFFDSGNILFFGLQGVGLVIERTLIPTSLRKFWLWATLILTGRWFIESFLKIITV